MSQSLLQFLTKHQYLLPVGISLLTIFMLVLMLIPSNMLGTSQLWSYDKIGHFVLFGSWTYTLGLYGFIKSKSRPNMLVLFSAGVSFGVFIEFLQYFLPVNRSAEPYDLLFDALGCLIAVILLIKTIKQER